MSPMLLCVTLFGMLLLAYVLRGILWMLLQVLIAIASSLASLAKIASGIVALGIITSIIANVLLGYPPFQEFWMGWARVLEIL